MLREPEIIVRSKINQRPAGTTDAGSADLVDRLQSPIQRSPLQIRDDLFVRIRFQWVRCEIATKDRKERKRNTANEHEEKFHTKQTSSVVPCTHTMADRLPHLPFSVRRILRG